MQLLLFESGVSTRVAPFKQQLLKWIGNKQRFAHEIAAYFPADYGTYFEPFLGSGAVLGTHSPKTAIASDSFGPLIEIWQALQLSPDRLIDWYTERWTAMMSGDKIAAYEAIKASYNGRPNGADLLFLSRSCYGGVVRFRKADGYMSTPCGPHQPISPRSFAERVRTWKERTRGTQFCHFDYKEAFRRTRPGDLVYCDPPYVHSQKILYGAQTFVLAELFEEIASCKSRGVFVALSIDGTKKSGRVDCPLPIPHGLFERVAEVNCGRSMLRRFQMDGKSLEEEVVTDRLLLTY
ncbi:MAG: DNA adenine methylase [Planctomycetales bacterium]|nr:DNA adenine methylase [Planctomycetales bacterium]